VPGWHVLTQPYAERGLLNVVGIIQEQHPERARLFMQWKEMGWPLLVDSLNLLGVSGAPITLFLDEAGVIQSVNPRRSDLASFIEQKPASWDSEAWLPPSSDALLTDNKEGERTGLDRQFLWGGEKGLSAAILGYQKVLAETPQDAKAHFRLGVSYRSRYDSAGREEADFQLAVKHWGNALDLNPNQYIWRRRIQQYGPRLSKPYSFYDWIHEARREVLARGDQPVSLGVEPGGAEFAHPEAKFGTEALDVKNPDGEGRIHRDGAQLVGMEVVAVPDSVKPGDAVRIHVVLRPDENRKVHWNNEVEDLILWVDGEEDWQVEKNLHRYQVPEQPVTAESRRLEFEVKTSDQGSSGNRQIHGYVLYYVCEDVNGQCLYRRQDFSVPISIKE
jgi:hypothetical protein